MMNESTRTACAHTEPAQPAPITGEARVDEALAALASLPDRPGARHVAAFEHAYERLRGVLDEIGTRQNAGEAPDTQTEHNAQAEQA